MNSNDKGVNKGEEELSVQKNVQLKDKNKEELSPVLKYLKWVEGLDGTEILFRGQSCCEWSVESGARRLYKNKDSQNTLSFTKNEVLHNENIINRAEMHGIYDKSNSAIAKTNWGILAQQQHNGAATSLLDFSASPLVALFFACQKCSKKCECECDQQGGKIYSIAVDDPNHFDQFDSEDKLKKYQVEKLIGENKSIYWKPAHINNRIIAQHSYFVIGGYLGKLEEFFIPEYIKEHILGVLHRIHDINRDTLFPDEAGLAEVNSTSPKCNVIYLEYLDTGLKFHRSGLYEEAIERYTKIIEYTKYNEYYKMQAYNNCGLSRISWGNKFAQSGQIQDAIKQYGEGIRDFNEAIKINNTISGIINVNAFIDDMRRMTKDLSKIYLTLGDTNIQLAKLYKNWGGDIKHKSLLNEAITYIDKALFYNKKYAEAYRIRGAIKLELEEYNSALCDLNASISINPNSYNAYLDRAYIRHIQIINRKLKNEYDNKEQLQVDYEESARDCDRFIMSYRNCYDAYISRGILNAALGKSKKIIQKDFDAAFEIKPEEADTKRIYMIALLILSDNLNVGLKNKGKVIEFIKIYEKYLRYMKNI